MIRNEAIKAGSQKGLKAGLFGIKARKIILLDRGREKALDQILCIFVRCLPLDTDVFISRFPIALDDGGKGALALFAVITARGDDCRMTGDGKAVVGAADVRVLIHVY